MKPKYKIGQRVFFMSDNVVEEEVVTGIFLTGEGTYYFTGDMSAVEEVGCPRYQQKECDLYPTKESLLKAL